jgi:N-acetylglutamate synthase
MSIDLRRLEEVSQNASRPERGMMIDGWSVGLSPSKAKRSRCVNPQYVSTRAFDVNFVSAQAAYSRAELPCIFRLTPWIADPSIDQQLVERGFERFDSTLVMAAEMSSLATAQRTDSAVSFHVESNPIRAAQIVTNLRGDSDIEREALAARWSQSAVPCISSVARSAVGEVLSHALLVLDDGFAGIFDVVTHTAHRGLGIGGALLEHALQSASANGAHTAYLQVTASNPAVRLYDRMGFRTVYEYWYRALPADIQAHQ